MHVSDCAVHCGNQCDCHGLNLASYPGDSLVGAHVTATGRFGFFINHMGRDCFIQSHELPPLTLATLASAADLPNAHDAISVLSGPDGVDLNNARESVISKLKAKTSIEGIASCRCVQLRISLPDACQQPETVDHTHREENRSCN